MLLFLINFSFGKEEWTAGTLSDYYYNKKLKNRVILDPDKFLNFKTKKRIFQIIKHVKIKKDLYINLIIINGISKKFYYDNNQKKIKIARFCKELFKNIISRKKPNNLLIVFDLKNLKYKLFLKKNSSKLLPNKVFNQFLDKIFPYLQNEEFDKAFEVLFEQIYSKFDDNIDPVVFIYLVIIIGFFFFILMLCLLFQKKSNNSGQSEYKKTDNKDDNKKKSGKEKRENKLIQGKKIEYPSFEDFEIKKCQKCFSDFGYNNLEKKNLKCGHRVHKKCLFNFYYCPICPKKDFQYQTTIQNQSTKIQYNSNPHLSEMNFNKNNKIPLVSNIHQSYSTNSVNNSINNNLNSNIDNLKNKYTPFENNNNRTYSKNNVNNFKKINNNFNSEKDLKKKKYTPFDNSSNNFSKETNLEEKKNIYQFSTFTIAKKVEKEVSSQQKTINKKKTKKKETKKINIKKKSKVTKGSEGGWKTNKDIKGSEGGWKINKDIESSEEECETNVEIIGSEGGW